MAFEDNAKTPSRAPSSEKINVKVYIVLRRIYTNQPNQPNVEVLDVKLTQIAAQQIKDAYAGTWIIRARADKLGFLSLSPQPVTPIRRKRVVRKKRTRPATGRPVQPVA